VILYGIITLILSLISLKEIFKPSPALISIYIISLYIVIQTLFKKQELSSIIWIVQLYFTYFLSRSIFYFTKEVPDYFIKLILKMGILSSAVGYIQILLNKRFLPASVEEKLNPDIFRGPLFGLFRLSGFSLNANSFGLFTSFVICIAIAYKGKGIIKDNIINTIILFMLPTLILSFSRGSMLFLVVVYLWLKISKRNIFISFCTLFFGFVLWFLSTSYGIIEFYDKINPRTSMIISILSFIDRINIVDVLTGFGFSDDTLRLISFSDNFVAEIIFCGGLIMLFLIAYLSSNIYSRIKYIIKDFNILKISIAYIFLSMTLYSSPNLLYFSMLPLFIIFYCYHYSKFCLLYKEKVLS
tara:strand:- start:108 stop:1175 length:1068 start_codon:yes stop_codon:yes gene_type:complete